MNNHIKVPQSRLFKICTERFELTSDTIHGPDHWMRVQANGAYISSKLGINDSFVTAFAWLHDCCRLNDHIDPEHGLRAAHYAKTLYGSNLIDISIDFEKLLFALEFHNKGQTSEDSLIGTCWDADRLDIGRAGIYPSADFMSTSVARDKAYIDVCYEKSLCIRQDGRDSR